MNQRLISTTYYGGKNRARLQEAILSALQPNHGYLEAFCGSCGVLLNRPPSKYEVINDLDGSVVNYFRVLRERPDELIEALSLTPFAKDEREECKRRLLQLPDLDDVEHARCWYLVMNTGQKGLVDCGFRSLPAKEAGFGPNTFSYRIRHRLRMVADRLHRVGINNTDGVKMIETVRDRPDWSVFADPPYPLETRTGSSSYRHESDDDLHVRLLDTCIGADCQIVIATFDSEMYRERLSGWHRVEIPIYKVASTIPGKEAPEVLYVNRMPVQTSLALD